MNGRFYIISLLALALMSEVAVAQTACPSGVASGSAQCGPSSMTDPAAAADNYTYRMPEARWADSWGAIAIDDTKGAVGAIIDMPSKRRAKSAAIEECKNRGGVKCDVSKVYKNQCAVIVAGAVKADVVNAMTIERATEIGMKACKGRSDSNCRIYYSGCSLANRIQ